MAANVNLTEDSNKEALPFKVFKITVYSVILLLCLLGNTLVMIVICKTKRMRIPSNLLILNLAVCDLITPLASIPFDLALEEKGYIWPFGRVLCKTLWPLATLSTISASLTLAIISLDRYRVIMHPFKQRLSSRQVKYSIAMMHLVALLFVLPYIYYLDLVGEESTKFCEETWPLFSYRQVYTLVLFIGQYGIPLAFMSVMYTMTLCNLRASASIFEKVQQRPSRVAVDGNLNNRKMEISPDFQRKASRVTLGQRHNTLVGKAGQNIRATKMFVTVVIVFATCRLPNEIFWLWSDFGNGQDQDHSPIVGIICRMFTYTNSIFNPVIYWMFSRDFKRGFKRIFTSVWKRKQDGLFDDSLDKSESHLRKISSINESFSFVWRKLSRSKSDKDSPMELKENQRLFKPTISNSPESSPKKTSRKISFHSEEFAYGPDKTLLGIAKRKIPGSVQLDDSFRFIMSPSQPRLSKSGEESSFDSAQEHGIVRIRRLGTVELPSARPLSKHTILETTQIATDGLTFFPNEMIDETIESIDLAEKENSQPISDKVSSLEIKFSFDNMKNDSGGDCRKETFLNHRDLPSIYFKFSSSLLNLAALKETRC